MAYSVAHLVFLETAEKWKKGTKSNNETPKNIPRRPLTILAHVQIILWSFNIAFGPKSQLFSERRPSISAGPQNQAALPYTFDKMVQSSKP